MRLTEARIRALSKQIARELIDRGAVDKKVGAMNLSTLVAQAMIHDQQVEEGIEAEARERLLRYRNLPPEGSGEYEAMFIKAKEEIAARKGYPL
ncbi:MAG: hypothetical protein PWP23_2172 [Candidatus Sumerlaeota bacterium]|nr:hypothetical protein [Candidatus Sumerlaeota bacterium]